MLASITSQTTDWIGQCDVYAVFALMTRDALVPLWAACW
jgi:hypothetical protein